MVAWFAIGAIIFLNNAYAVVEILNNLEKKPIISKSKSSASKGQTMFKVFLIDCTMELL